MNYQPGPSPYDDKNLREYLSRELRKIADSLRDDARVVFYRTSMETLTATAAVSANFKMGIATNIARISTSNTVTLTGIADKVPLRERVIFNVGTGVLVLKSEGTESSASYRFALPSTWQLSANAACSLYYDPVSSRHRGLSRT
jgi:hypothetical protein